MNMTMKINNILWAYDCSEESKFALKYVEYFSKHYKAKVYGIHVYSISLPINPYYAPYLYDVAEKTEKKYQEEFRELSESLEKKNIDFESEIIRGDVATEIVNFANEKETDLIIMGISSRGFIGSMLIESSSIEVLRKTHKPILITKSSDVDAVVKPKKILVPVDIGEKLPDALKTAIFMSEKEGCHITVVYVMNIAFQIYEIPEKIISEIIDETTADLKKFVDEIVSQSGVSDNGSKDFSVLTKVLFGINPAAKIVNYAKRNNFDLILVNSHGKGVFKRFLLGSTAEQIARETSCPVMVVKPELIKRDESNS